MSKRLSASRLASAPHARHAMEPPLQHPRSVPIFEDGARAGELLDQPFEEGSRDEIDPDLRQRLISEAAFELYRQRGFQNGYDMDDWLQAEAQVDHLLLRSPDEDQGGEA